MAYKDYTDPAVAQEYWLNNIAPNYFNFDTADLHHTGVYGFVNEVMSSVENDTAHAVSIARREFYPTTANYTKSFYKMAALQQISYPFANAAHATAIILMSEDEIIKYAEFSNGRYKFVLDNTAVISADGVPFLMDHPLVIIAKPTYIGATILDNGASTSGKNKYAYTLRYDSQYKNDMDTSNKSYVMSRVVTYNGTNYLLCKVNIHQCSMELQSQNINLSPVLNNITLDFPFTGKLCNFEVFYRESENTATYQLKKLPLNSNAINDKFCMFSLIDQQTLRISFPENAYFNPKFNSTVDVKIYTTMGSEGNFTIFKGTLQVSMNSEDYPYNNMCTISGQIQGSSIGGTDLPSQDDFRLNVQAAYATNKTITTDGNLQTYFDQVMNNNRTKVIFQKKRDDVFERLYGAYTILKDVDGNIVPTNTLTLDIKQSQVDTLFESYGRAIVKPGKVLKYQNDDHYYSSDYNLYCTDFKLNTDITDNTNDFCYTNIFLMQIMKSPNLVGYYFNTINSTVALDLSAANDNSYMQFAVNGFTVKRNAIKGDNFYKLSVSIQPSVVNSGLHEMAFITAEDMTTIDSFPVEIRAEYSGIVEKFEYLDSAAYMVIRYEPDIPNVTRSSLTKYVTEPSMPTDADDYDFRIWIRISAPVVVTTDVNSQNIYSIPAWYKTQLEAGDTFTAGSVIATRCIADTGVIRVIAELDGDTFGHYIPMILENYDDGPDVYTFTAYISTDDVMNADGRLEIIHGFSVSKGEAKDYVSIDPSNCKPIVSTFIQYNDVNYSHTYSAYDYVKNHTMTNTFRATDDTFDFIMPLGFIRSTISYDQIITGETEEPDASELFFRISEVPLVRSNWLKNVGNIYDLVNLIKDNYDALLMAYGEFENNYSIDMKFFNTYGKSRFFRIGIRDLMTTMEKVNIVLKFGVKVNILSPYEEFKSRFVAFVRNYIESFNDVTNTGNTIYIMDLISEIKNNFSEIERLEYYGIDNYSVSEAQLIECLTIEQIRQLGYRTYIPELINIYCDYYNNVLTPMIDITVLE